MPGRDGGFTVTLLGEESFIAAVTCAVTAASAGAVPADAKASSRRRLREVVGAHPLAGQCPARCDPSRHAFPPGPDPEPPAHPATNRASSPCALRQPTRQSGTDRGPALNFDRHGGVREVIAKHRPGGEGRPACCFGGCARASTGGAPRSQRSLPRRRAALMASARDAPPALVVKGMQPPSGTRPRFEAAYLPPPFPIG